MNIKIYGLNVMFYATIRSWLEIWEKNIDLVVGKFILDPISIFYLNLILELSKKK